MSETLNTGSGTANGASSDVATKGSTSETMPSGTSQGETMPRPNIPFSMQFSGGEKGGLSVGHTASHNELPAEMLDNRAVDYTTTDNETVSTTRDSHHASVGSKISELFARPGQQNGSESVTDGRAESQKVDEAMEAIKGMQDHIGKIDDRIGILEQKLQELTHPDKPNEEAASSEKEEAMTPEQIEEMKQRFTEDLVVKAITGDMPLKSLIANKINMARQAYKTINLESVIDRVTSVASEWLKNLERAVNGNGFRVGNNYGNFASPDEARQRIQALYKIGLIDMAGSKRGIINAYQKAKIGDDGLELLAQGSGPAGSALYDVKFSAPKAEMYVGYGLGVASKTYEEVIRKRILKDPHLKKYRKETETEEFV